MSVIELARLAGVTPNVIRYYARIGLLKPKRNPGNNYKKLGLADVKYVRFIRHAQRLRFTLAEITEIIEISHHGNTPCPMVRETIGRRIKEQPYLGGAGCPAEQDGECSDPMKNHTGRSCDMHPDRSD